MDKTMLDAARAYVSRGFSVIPLRPKDKKPVIQWTEYQSRRPEDAELVKWFGNGSKNNIGIVTGDISGIAIVDLDSVKAVEFWKTQKFSLTPLVKTGKGYHLYYCYREGVRNFQKRDDLPDIDLRGDGGFVVAPPSIHPSGAQYLWVTGKGLDDLPFADLPEIVFAQKPEDKIPLKELYQGVEKGSRNDALARLTGSWVNDGLSFNDCLENARLWNGKNEQPLPYREVEKTVRSIFEKHHKEQNVISLHPTDTSEWTDPIPLDDYSLLPDFPIEALPEAGRRMVKAVSEVNQVDSGMTASIYLSILSACVTGKGIVQLINFQEPLNIYSCSILPSGNRKSSTMNIMTKPLYDYQKEQQEAMQESIREALNAHNIREARLAKLQKLAANAEDISDRRRYEMEAADAAKIICANPVPKAPLFIIDDVTPEALGIHMADNNERIAVMSTEGGIFEIMAGRYNDSKGGNLDLYLKAHSGDSWSSHRVGREAKTMQSPALTMCLTVQPDVIKELGANKQFRGRGLLARFLYCLCRSQVGYRERQTSAIPEAIAAEYRDHLMSLMDMPITASTLKFSADAQVLWDEFYNDIEADLREGGSLHYLTDWGSKLSGAVARIAGLLHFAKNGLRAVELPISVNIVSASCLIGCYYKEHVLATFGLMNSDPSIESAKKILNYLKTHSPETFKGRDVLRHTNLRKMDEVIPGLKILLERGYIREVRLISSVMGRPEAMTYEVNPKIKILKKH